MMFRSKSKFLYGDERSNKWLHQTVATVIS